MTFSVRGLFYLIAFLTAVAVALNARGGEIPPWFGMLGLGVIVLVDGVLTFWSVVGPRHRTLQDH